MFSLGSSHTYHLYRGVCDMRKSFDGLSGLVRSELKREPASGEVFIFVNRRRSLLKLLHWQPGGFVLYYKRLEQGTFALPEVRGDHSHISWPDLVMMVEGIRVQSSVQLPRYRGLKRDEKAP